MQESHIEVVGNLTADPIIRVVGAGTPVSRFRVASTPRWRDRESGQWRDGDTTFFNVSCWRNLAENVNETLHKGDRVVVLGRLRERAYVTADGVERTSIDIDADLVGPDLNRHTALLRKAMRSPRPVEGDGVPNAGGAEPAAPQPVSEAAA